MCINPTGFKQRLKKNLKNLITFSDNNVLGFGPEYDLISIKNRHYSLSITRNNSTK